MNQQLLSYISEQLQAGLSYSEIEAALLGVGWDTVEVKQALASFASQQNQASNQASTQAQDAPATVVANPIVSEPMPVQQPTVVPAEPTQDTPSQVNSSIPDTSALASVVGETAVNNATVAPNTSQQNADVSTSQITQPTADISVASPSQQLSTSVEPTSSAQNNLAQPAPATQPTPKTELVPTSESGSVSQPVAPVTQPSQLAPTQADTNQSVHVANPTGQTQYQTTAPSNQINNSQPVFATQNTAPAQPIVQQMTQPYQAPQMQAYQANGATMAYGPQPGPSYGQPTSKPNTGGMAGLLSKKMIIIIASGVGFLILLLVIALVISSTKKGTSTSNNSNTSTQSNSGSLTEPQAFISDRGGFSINPPKGWHAQELTNSSDITVAISKETTDKSQFSSMSVTASTIQDTQVATTNLDSFVNFYKSATAQSNPTTKVNDDQKITLDGVEARLLDVDTVNDNTKVTGYMVYMIKDKKLYQIQAFTYDVAPNSEIKKSMHQSIESFKFAGGSSSSGNNSDAMPTPKS